MNLASAPQVKKLLAEYGLHPKKRLGQNFLIDRNVLNRIADASEAAPGSNILEIGPGLGVVTRALLDRGARVVCVEADRDFLPILESVAGGESGAEIIIEDFLKIDLPSFFGDRGGGKWRVVGNLPYYITSGIIGKLLESKRFVSEVLLMVQKEVAARLQARPDSQEYGALTVFVQYHCEVESITRVSRNVFYPIPDVDSEIIRLRVRSTPKASVSDERLFFQIVKAAFGKRRKTLFNALGSSTELNWDKAKAREVLDAAGIDGTRRGETLSIEEFASLTEAALPA